MIAVELSTSSLTMRAALVIGGAVLLLLMIGRPKPARPRWWLPRARTRNVPAFVVERQPTPLYRGARWWERTLAVVGVPALAIVIGAVIATSIAAALIFVVTALSDRLT